jgi:hypothetical protein
MNFEAVGPVEDIETIAVGGSIRSLPRLRRDYGQRRWRKLKGFATLTIPPMRIAALRWGCRIKDACCWSLIQTAKVKSGS